MRALLKARASLDGEDTVTWFAGNIYAWMPDGEHHHVFGLEGYNVARVVEADGGYDLLTREAVFYLDPLSREILDRWTNPFTGNDVPVVHIWNDPVNQLLRVDGPRGPFRLPVMRMGDDVFMNMDVLLAYPSPLPRAEFPDHSQADLYHAAELFQFFCKAADFDDADRVSIPAQVSWTRIAPWVPFMGMGDRPGNLVYHCRGTKLAGGYADLPAAIREHVEANKPEFAAAPREISGPNETSWTYFRKLVASGEFDAGLASAARSGS
jgi:hypothetical protein